MARVSPREFEALTATVSIFAVYVRNVGRLKPLYIALIDPFRKLIVYPSLLRSMRATWNATICAPARGHGGVGNK
jgi:hypothetical protein